MGTDYILSRKEAVEVGAFESSTMIELYIERDDRPDGEHFMGTGYVFNDQDLIDIAVKLVRIASYYSDEPEQIRARLNEAMDQDDYLGSMPVRRTR